jgi:endonuclease YncB( thermonuclease family)
VNHGQTEHICAIRRRSTAIGGSRPNSDRTHIAAPEWDTPAGEAATKALREMVLGKLVSCELTGKATYNRCVAVSYLDGIDIEAEMVRTGLARDWPRYSGGRHADAERAAAADGATIAAT